MKLRKWSPRFLRFFSLFIYSILNVSIAFALTFTLSHAYCFFFFYYYDVLFFLSLFLPRTFILFKILKIFTRNKFKLIICHVKHAQVKRQALVDIKEDLYNSFFFFFSSGGMSNLIEQGSLQDGRHFSNNLTIISITLYFSYFLFFSFKLFSTKCISKYSIKKFFILLFWRYNYLLYYLACVLE